MSVRREGRVPEKWVTARYDIDKPGLVYSQRTSPFWSLLFICMLFIIAGTADHYAKAPGSLFKEHLSPPVDPLGMGIFLVIFLREKLLMAKDLSVFLSIPVVSNF